MRIIRNYAFVSALVLGVIYIYAPLSLKNLAMPRWLDDIGEIINASLAPARRQASVSPVDPVAAANLDEDLDYRIAQHVNSADGWRAFLTAHPNGPHAQLASAELDTLVRPETPPAPVAAVEAADGGTPLAPPALNASDNGAQLSGEAASQVPPPPRSEAATQGSDEICRGDEDRLEQLSSRPTGDAVIRFLIELRCEKLRPQLLRLAERLEDKAPAGAADIGQGASSTGLAALDVSAAPLPPARTRANELEKKKRSTLSSRGIRPKRRANRHTAPNLPPLLLALFGERPRNPTGVRRPRAGAGSNGEAR